MLFVVMKERVEHAKIRAVMQGIIDKEKGVEVFEEYMKVAFPWIETAKGRERLDHIKKLMNEVNRGPIAVTAASDPNKKMRSRLREKIERPKDAPPTRDMSRFYDKLGNKTLMRR